MLNGTTRNRIISPSTKWLLARAVMSLSLLFNVSYLSGQDDYLIDVHYLSEEEGLSSRFVKRIFQDSRGFMWFWTSKGVDRYDGQSFCHFQVPGYTFVPGGSHHFFEDRNGCIWIVKGQEVIQQQVSGWTDVRIWAYRYGLDTLTPLEQIYPELGVRQKDIFGISQGQDRELWIGTRQGGVYRFESGSVQKAFSLAINTPVNFLTAASDTTLWIVGPKSIGEYALDGRLIRLDKLPFIPYTIRKDAEGVLWVSPKIHQNYVDWNSAMDTLTAFIRPGGPLEYYRQDFELEIAQFNSVFSSPDGRLWCVFAGDSFPVYEEGKGQVYNLAEVVGKSNRLIGPQQVFFGADAAAWVIASDGVYRISIKVNPFRRLLYSEGISVRGIEKPDSATLWANTYRGFIECSLESSIYNILPSKILYAHGTGVLKEERTLWLGIHNQFIIRYDQEKQLSRKFLISGEGISGKSRPAGLETWQPFRDSRGRLWVSASKGLTLLDTVAGTLKMLTDSHMAYGHFIYHLMETEGKLWIGSSNGLYCLDITQETIKPAGHYLSGRKVVYVYNPSKGVFWLAMHGEGLAKWSPHQGLMRMYGLKDGLPNDYIHAIYEYEQGLLWMPSDKGLIRFDTKKEQFTVFLEHDGVAHNEFNQLAHFQDADGRLFFGGLDGITSFHPKDLQGWDWKPPLQLTGLKVLKAQNGHWESCLDELLRNDTLILNHPDNSLQLEFALLDYQAKGNISYAYRIEGQEEEWNALTQNKIRIDRLPPGKHTVYIRGRGYNGMWSRQELQVPVIILRPFYEKAWFWGFCSLLAGLFIWAVVRLRIYRLKQAQKRLEAEVKKRTEELEALNHMKDKLFAMIGHELRGPLGYFQSIGKNLAYLIRRGEYDRALKIGEQLEKTSIMANIMLDNLLRWGLAQTKKLPYRPQAAIISPIVRELVESFTPIAEEKRIIIKCEEAEKALVLFVDVSALQLILRNLVGNAVKFTGDGGEVAIRSCRDEKWGKITVQDTGIGIAPERLEQIFQLQESTSGTDGEKGAGLGLHLCKELVKANQGKIEVFSQPGAGTAFVVFLPLAVPAKSFLTVVL